MGLRVGVVILPDLRWPAARDRWREAEQRGFATAWTYDHLSWRSLRDGPWLGAIPLLSAAAAVTSTLRLGTLVTTPNFRHPAPLAKEVMSLDEISGGRVELGIGAGGTGWDSTALGNQPHPPETRHERFGDFVAALDVMLRQPAGDYQGEHFQAPEYRTYPGCIQQPRVPFTIAATGRRGISVAAEYGACWVTFGPIGAEPGADPWFAGVERQVGRLNDACLAQGREPSSIRRMALVSLDATWADGSRSRWDDFTARITESGFTDVVVHWPRPEDPALPGCDPAVFDALTFA